MKEVKDLCRQKAIPCPWIGRLKIVKGSVVSYLTNKFNPKIKFQQVILWISTNRF